MEKYMENYYDIDNDFDIVGEIYDKLVESTTSFFHVMYAYCDFCVEHNMV